MFDSKNVGSLRVIGAGVMDNKKGHMSIGGKDEVFI